MHLCYFDLETTGPDPRIHKIITIQYQCLDDITLKPLGDLVVLKEWEEGEKGILEEFLNVFVGKDPFEFVPVGVDLLHDFAFLYHRTKQLLPEVVRSGRLTVDYLLMEKPFIDLKHILVMVERFVFRCYDSTIEFRAKEKSGYTREYVPRLYLEGKYDEILKYVRAKAEVVLDLLRELYNNFIPKLRDLLRASPEESSENDEISEEEFLRMLEEALRSRPPREVVI